MSNTEKSDAIFIIGLISVMSASIILSLYEFIVFKGIRLELDCMRLLGMIFIISGFIIRRSALKSLGKFYSFKLRIMPNHRVVRTGLYRYIRHPAYLGAILMSLGGPLVLDSLYGFLMMSLIIPFYLYRIRIEEKMLLKKLGNEYLNYIKTTWRLIPYIY